MSRLRPPAAGTHQGCPRCPTSVYLAFHVMAAKAALHASFSKLYWKCWTARCSSVKVTAVAIV